jgi:hypothetical protein
MMYSPKIKIPCSAKAAHRQLHVADPARRGRVRHSFWSTSKFWFGSFHNQSDFIKISLCIYLNPLPANQGCGLSDLA